MTAFIDPRVRMRSALRQLVQQEPTRWHEPSMLVFRNRLLDETGSDARPLAELLVEAIQRGWRDRLPPDRLDAARWDTLSAPFVMQWSAERFVQLEMAQWAAESWAFAFGVIAPEQLRIAPLVSPARPEQRSRATTVPATVPVAVPARGARGARAASLAARPALSATAAQQRRGLQIRTPQRASSAPSRIPPLSPRIAKAIAIAAGLSYLGFIARIAWAVRNNRRTTEVSATAGAGTAAVPTAAVSPPRSAPEPAPAMAAMSAPAAATVPSPAPATLPAPATAPTSETASATLPSGSGPGVPSVTRNLLDARVVDPARMLYVEPARRAVGNSRPVAAVPGASTSPVVAAYDEIFLNDGSSMRGRVDVVRAGVVIFQDRRTGLRHEIRKDDIDRIITEFGAPVRFRVADNVPDATNRAVTAARARADNGPRGRGVAGVYDVRYGSADAAGSKECTDLWKKTPNTVDVATVRHVPGADTLRVLFAGGDTFLSNMDADGFFASTFRIVPDQARTSTALTTRLTGQFKTNGALALQVIIVFYRRMRSGDDITCTVNVNAVGQRRAI